MANPENFKVRKGLTIEPSTTAASENGAMRVDSAASNALKYYNGSERTVVNTDEAQTLTNKTISGSSNTLSNIARSSISAGTANHVIINDGSGNLSSVAPGSSGNVLTSNGTSWSSQSPTGSGTISFTTKTVANNGNNISNTDTLHLIDTSGGGFSMTLPDCASNSGKIFKFVKITSDFDAYTINRAGSDTIREGVGSLTSTRMDTMGEEIELLSLGGTVWQVINRRIPSQWTSFTVNMSGFGTTSSAEGFWRRVGNEMEVRVRFTAGTVAASTASMAIPSSLVTETSGVIDSTISLVGYGCISGNNADQLTVLAEPGASSIYFGQQGSGENGLAKANANSICSNTDDVSFFAKFPINDWNG